MARRREREAEERARTIAIAFLRGQTGTEPHCDRGNGRGDSWSFWFRIPTAPGEVIDPSHWIIEVDLAAQTARFFHTM